MEQQIWIIDGYNLIRRDAMLRQSENEQGTVVARALLESQLLHVLSSRGRGVSIVLAYDGSAEGNRRLRKGLRIVYPGPGRTADDVVLAEARRAEGRSTVRVVTSDYHDIGRRLRGLRVQHVTTGEFSQELWKGIDGDDSAGAGKPENVSESDVGYWMREFGEEE